MARAYLHDTAARIYGNRSKILAEPDGSARVVA